MLNKLERFARQYGMIRPGDRIICAVSGGADSMALLFAMYLLREKWGITLSAAHFNHHLRGEESDRDEGFVRDFCDRFDIPLHLGSGQIAPGKKGLEAAARDARYAFLNTLPGKIATAHTADDNAETVLMHLIRGTGLKGLGAIAPVNGKLIRPMLQVTRDDVEQFLEEYHIAHIEDSSNESDRFLRNRIRHQVMPLLRGENPSIAANLSAMALRLRQDEDALAAAAQQQATLDVAQLRQLHPAIRARVLEGFLKECGVREPEAEHITLAETLVFSDKPSACAAFPGGVTVGREYGVLTIVTQAEELGNLPLNCPGVTDAEQLGLRIICSETQMPESGREVFTVVPQGQVVLRSRQAGDTMRFPGGTKSLKKWFIDEKIPAARRLSIPVIADDLGVLGIYGGGANLNRCTGDGPMVRICFEKLEKENVRKSD